MSGNIYTKQGEEMSKMDFNHLVKTSEFPISAEFEGKSTFEKQVEESSKIDFNELVNTSEFKKLSKSKSRFLRISVIIFSTFYIIMPFLTGYTNILEKRAIGYITWTWIYAFGIFAMVGVFSIIYARKAAKFDKNVEKILSHKFQEK